MQVEARTIGGARHVAYLDPILESWQVTVAANEITSFTGTVDPDADCSDILSKLHAWWTEIQVTDDNGEVLAVGPLTGAPKSRSQVASEGVTIEAPCMLWWLKKRAIRATIDHHLVADTTTAAVFVGEVFASALSIADPNLIPHMVVHTGGAAINPIAEAYESNAWPAITEFLGASCDVWCRGRAIHIAPPGTCFGQLGAFGPALLGGSWQLRQLGDEGVTRSIVKGADGLLVDAGGPILGSDGVSQVLIEEILKDERVTNPLTAQAMAAGRNLDQALVALTTGDLGDGWVDCSAGLSPIDLAVGACLTLELPGTVSIDARITAVRHSFDGTNYRSGVRIMDRNRSVL